jgi:hypothetical protein
LRWAMAVDELTSLVLTEDAATIVRRLLELAVQLVYIARDDDEKTRDRRAGMYLAFLWHEWPAELRNRLPPDERKAWEALYAEYDRRLLIIALDAWLLKPCCIPQPFQHPID